MTPPSNPQIPPGATAEQILQVMLPLVVQAASDSASSATSAGAAVQAVEGRLASLEDAVRGNTEKLERLVALREQETGARESQQQWLRSIFTPSTVLIIIAIFAAAFGIRVSLPGATLGEVIIEEGP